MWSSSTKCPRSNRIFLSFLCLIALSIVASTALASADLSYPAGVPDTRVCLAQPLQSNDSNFALLAAAGSPPVIVAFNATPLVLSTADAAAVYTFKVKNAYNVVVTEDGNTIRLIVNPTLAALNGTVTGLPAATITPDAGGNFVTVLTASNEGGTVQATVTLSLGADLLPPPPGTASTDNQTKPRSPQWLEQYTTPITTLPSTTITRNQPNFYKCPNTCAFCLKESEAAGMGYTSRCSDQRCYYSPDDKQNWYCYSEPVGWCCANNTVSQSTKSECAKLNGYWSTSQADATQVCQPMGWCCVNGNLYQATRDQCIQLGGSYWSTDQAQVMANCRQQIACWCCAGGKVFQATQEQCSRYGGGCYASQSEAQAACYQAPPPIRYPNLK